MLPKKAQPPMTILPSLNHPPYRNTALDGIGRRLAFESEKCQDKSKVGKVEKVKTQRSGRVAKFAR
jgi:hypothetical protein